ncbi:MAG TPA: sugar nucleotide-binding protein [Gemmatimonas sp.]|nr:sugar nucleotide-binding protein [Gemmatimonas sp.]
MTRHSGSVPSGKSDSMLPPLEMWAGIECTINRVRGRFRDQLAMVGHYDRPDDVERLADLGVQAVRWPVLWERHLDSESAWRLTDRAMEVFRRRGIDPIVGLVHHGSGPLGTNLLDEGFPGALAVFGARVAARYPWVRRFTPVNEPLTTARFSALYGLWYPHARNAAAFIRATVNQTLAVQQAMAAIRKITPHAELVATEDLGYTHSSATLRYQAAFENERRWLTFDLLNGLVDRNHSLWSYLTRSAPVREPLLAIANAAADPAARPAIHGINHYLTSERFLDEVTRFYPRQSVGGNGRHRYADVEAVRVLRDGPLGPQRLMEQTCTRYGTPVAVTEAHLACTREQQMLWLHEVWTAAQAARARGHDIRAVTTWSAFGATDWQSLLTKSEGAYESGVYDLRAPVPRATALVPMVRALAATGQYDHPVLTAESWWKRTDRLAYPPHRGTTPRVSVDPGMIRTTGAPRATSPRPLLITGGSGTLGVAMGRLAKERGLRHIRTGRQDLDITDESVITEWIDSTRPWAVVNTAGWVRVDDAEGDPDACMRSNVEGAECIARACARAGIPFVTFSSDLVFGGDPTDSAGGGDTHRPLVESDRVDPLNVYGRSKVEAERRVLAAAPDALVVRSSAFFGDWDDWNFVSRTLASLHAGNRAVAPTDAIVSPTYVTDLGHAVLDLLIDGESGVWHVANAGAFTWLELVQHAAERAGLDPERIDPCQGADIGWSAPRPAYAALTSERATLLGSLDNALARYARSRAWERVARAHPDAFIHKSAASTLSVR